MIRKNFCLPVPTIAALWAHAKLRGLSASEIVRRALDEYLAKQR